MAKVIVDKEKCIGCGTCVSLCPDCFKLGEDNKAEVIKSDCERGEGCNLKEAVESCPVDAISVEK
jgi:ferredoxin